MASPHHDHRSSTTSASGGNTSSFPKSKRLRRKVEFDSVYRNGMGITCHPLRIISMPNDLKGNRLGLAVPKRVGVAVRRNRVRRCLREAFRHLRWQSPTGYDVMIIVRANQNLAPDEYQNLIIEGLNKLHERWNKKIKPS